MSPTVCNITETLKSMVHVQSTSRSVLDWAVMANMYHLQKFLARCELYIMKHYHTNPSSRAFIAALSPESQLRIYRYATMHSGCLRFMIGIGHSDCLRVMTSHTATALSNKTKDSIRACLPCE